MTNSDGQMTMFHRQQQQRQQRQRQVPETNIQRLRQRCLGGRSCAQRSRRNLVKDDSIGPLKLLQNPYRKGKEQRIGAKGPSRSAANRESGAEVGGVVGVIIAVIHWERRGVRSGGAIASIRRRCVSFRSRPRGLQSLVPMSGVP